MPRSSASTAFAAELAATLKLATPLVVANLLQMAIYAVDVLFVARLGKEALAASSLGVAVFASMMWGMQGLASGAAPLLAVELGRRAHAVREVRRTVRMAVWLSLACWLGGTLVCLGAEPLMMATGQDPGLSALAGQFVLILSLSIAPTVASGVLRTFVAALGRPMLATVITALAIAVNAFGNWVFVFGNLGVPSLGLNGSAVSTVLTAIATFAAYAIAIARDRRLRRYRLFGRWWRPEWERLRSIVRIGAPIAVTVIAEGGLFNSAAFLFGRIGTVELAAHTVALQISAFFFQIPMGISQAATIRVGYFCGSADRQAIGRAGWAAIVSCLGFQGAGAAVMLLAPRLVIAPYLGWENPANAAIVAFAVQYLAVGAAFQLFDGVQAVAAGALRGLQDTRTPMVVALSGYWLVGFVASFWLGLGTPLEGVGVWMGLALGLVVVAAMLLTRWARRETIGLGPAVSAGPSRS